MIHKTYKPRDAWVVTCDFEIERIQIIGHDNTAVLLFPGRMVSGIVSPQTRRRATSQYTIFLTWAEAQGFISTKLRNLVSDLQKTRDEIHRELSVFETLEMVDRWKPRIEGEYRIKF